MGIQGQGGNRNAGDIAEWPYHVTRGPRRMRGLPAYSDSAIELLHYNLHDALAALYGCGAEHVWLRHYRSLREREARETAEWLHARCLASLEAAGSVMMFRWEGSFERL